MVSKTIELRKDIKDILSQAHERVFYRRAKQKDAYPYIVYSIKDVYGAKVLEIDFWDRDINDSTRNIETMVDKVEELLDKYTLTNENHSITLYSNEDRKWIDDEDKTIQRINESFEIRYYGKE
ncbi:hypothetical protein [Clostridium sp. UBA5712]|uniref:hypothetical protein n=1 Tax=Clostridium sp. UBA5712 TaxID=1946368 RepID=UPI0032165203